jgi:hypothetical protein
MPRSFQRDDGRVLGSVALACPISALVSSRRWIEQAHLARYPVSEISALTGIDVRPWRLRGGNGTRFAVADTDSHLFHTLPCLSAPSGMRHPPWSMTASGITYESWHTCLDASQCWQTSIPSLLHPLWDALDGSPTAWARVPSMSRLVGDSGKLQVLDAMLKRYVKSRTC